jgi:glycosyltransferase involved in cell wall biosynthesis
MRGKVNVINMDGLEWKRAKWGVLHKAWLYANERLACLLGDHLIADNPEIQAHLRTRVRAEKISFVPYGAEGVAGGDPALLHPLGVAAHRYVSLIARLEPENSILEIVRAFSRRKRGHDLLVLGSFDPDGSAYHRKVKAAASSEVKLLGAIYDEGLVSSIRFFSRAYVHGHQVGGTNPSLVEALGAGCAVMAHDNRFNRWVAGTAGRYFRTEDECAALFDTLLDDDHSIEKMRAASRVRHAQAFTWGQVFSDYEALLRAWCERQAARVTQQLRPADEGAESDT